jgi:hypothetical protein
VLDQRGLGVDVLPRDRVLAEQRAVARQRHARGLELRLVAHARALGLHQRLLVRTRIDARQQLALGDGLALGVEHLGEHAADLRLEGDGRQRRHRAQRLDGDRQLGPARRGMADGGARTAEAAAAAGRFVRALDQVPGAAPQGQNQRQSGQAAQPAPAARWRPGRVWTGGDGVWRLGGGGRHRSKRAVRRQP